VELDFEEHVVHLLLASWCTFRRCLDLAAKVLRLALVRVVRVTRGLLLLRRDAFRGRSTRVRPILGHDDWVRCHDNVVALDIALI
jgi:hypothetical protein